MPSDGLLVDGSDVTCNESALTGESEDKVSTKTVSYVHLYVHTCLSISWLPLKLIVPALSLFPLISFISSSKNVILNFIHLSTSLHLSHSYPYLYLRTCRRKVWILGMTCSFYPVQISLRAIVACSLQLLEPSQGKRDENI